MNNVITLRKVFLRRYFLKLDKVFGPIDFEGILKLAFSPVSTFGLGILSEVAGCDSENSPILRQKGSGKAEFYPSPQKNFYILLFFQQPGLQSFESTQLTKGWLSQTLHLNKGPGKER